MLKPYKIVDRLGSRKYGVAVSALEDLMNKGKQKYEIELTDMKVILESDGTEVLDDEYFQSLEPNTCLVILRSNEDWVPPSQYCYSRKHKKMMHIDEVDTDHTQCTGMLINSEILPSSSANVQRRNQCSDKIEETDYEFFSDTMSVQDALHLLDMYEKTSSNKNKDTSAGKG